MTYPIYLLHQTVGGATAALLARSLGLGFLPALAAGLAMVGLVTFAVVRWAEPAIRPAFQRTLQAIVPFARAGGHSTR
jgi:hypothetical protein